MLLIRSEIERNKITTGAILKVKNVISHLLSFVLPATLAVILFHVVNEQNDGFFDGFHKIGDAAL